jgi:hypothetical protein
MNTPTPSTAWERTTTRRFLRWLFSWQTVRRTLIAAAWVVTLIALLYGEENWRGRRAWNQYQQKLEAQGAQLDLQAFIPPPVPDDQNFAATPFVTAWFPKGGARWEDNYSKAEAKLPGQDTSRRQFLDLVAWGTALKAAEAGSLKPNRSAETGKLDAESRAQAAPAVLAGLQDDEAIFQELRSASRRPQVRYPVIYNLDNPWGILLPHLAKIKATCYRLRLKACAELAAGQPDRALEDLRLLFYMADSLKSEPFLISYLVRLSCLELASQPVWEGLSEHRWTAGQLGELQARLQRFDLLNDVSRPRAAERAAIILTADLLYRQKYRLSDLGEMADTKPPFWTTGFANLLGRMAPHGWYYLEQINACRFYQDQSPGAFDPVQKRISPRLLAADVKMLEQQLSGGGLGPELNALLHHQVLATLLQPGAHSTFANLPLKVASAQATVDQAALACALERCRLAEGWFPEKLEALVPRFMAQLPKDALTGEPYRYRRASDGQFVLYSIGWDEQDDGGVSGGAGRKALFDEQGDWVW